MKIRRLFIWSVLSLVTGLGSCLQCPSSDNESLLLQRGRAYKYRYRSEALAEAVGTTDDGGRVLLECDATLHHDRPCLHHLHLEGCALTAEGGRPGSRAAWMDREPLPGLSTYPVSFSLENGQINVIKIHEEDPLHFVNIKRGVLSAFVFKMSQTEREVRENHTDVHGTCPLTSRPGAEPSTVQTSKDMLHCHLPSRPDWQFSPWSLFWNMSFIQHFINSTTDCTYSVDRGQRRIDEVICRERHAIMLESTHRTTTAVQTNVNYHLAFVSEEQARNPWSGRVVLARKSGIQYEYEDTAEPRSSPPRFLARSWQMLSDLVLDSAEEIRLSTIPQFTDLVAWFRSSHDLRPLVDSVTDCAFLPEGVPCDGKIKDLAISFLSDALLQCNSLPCVQALTHLATKGDLSPAYLDIVYQSWSYMHHAQPSFIENFRVLCKSTKSHQCWLSLGSYIQRLYNRATDVSLTPYKYMVGKEARETAISFRVRIREDCESSEEDSKTLPDCLIFLKAASNMGRYYGRVLRPEGINQLLDVATNENYPVVVRVSSLESLKVVSDPDERDERDIIYDQLLPLLKNESLAASVRILAYDQLLAASEDHYFEEHLLGLMKDEKNIEVRHYVASNLDSLMEDKDFRAKRWKLVYNLNDLLRENGLSLQGILYESKGKSKSSSYSSFLNLPFLPDSMRRFGLKIRDTFLYDSPIHPSVVSHETVLQLFSALLPETKLGGYFEGFEELLLAYQKNLREMDSRPPTASRMYEALARTLGEFGRDVLEEGSLRNFDEGVLSNLKKLHQLYWQHRSKVNPFARAYFDLFGSTIKYFTLDNLHSGSVSRELGDMMKSVTQKLAEGATYSRTRVVRLIEAYHQVPTLMGLPLNWTTNATLAFSVRAGLKYDASGKSSSPVQASGFLEPSAALTFLNRMVLDFPTITQIGVQANSSGYTSTQLKARFDYSEGKQSLRFERPSKTQKVLELFRTNQLIKHDRYEDIEDWDFERTSSSWCSKEDVGGLKFCLSKSYPNVTHRIKPWALMAGWCKWQFLVHPTSQSPAHYDFELQQAAKDGNKKKQYDAKVSFTEGDVEKATRLRATVDDGGRAKSLELKTSLSPDFSFFLTRTDLTAGKVVSGHKVEAKLQLRKDFTYKLDMSSEDKVLKSPFESGSPPDEENLTKLHEEKASLTTPYGAYMWNRTSKKIGENVKAEAYASYENLGGGKSTWLKSTLPPSFWEDEGRASAKVRLHWKKPIHDNKGTVTRHTEFLLQIPRYVMTLNANGLESTLRQQSTFRLARTDVNHGKLDAFLNLTLDWWSNEDRTRYRKDIGTANLTIPMRSWEASFQQIGEYARYQHEIKLRRALMRPKNDVKSDYVGWWSEEVGDRFSVDEQEVRLTADNSWEKSSAEALVDKYSTVTREHLAGLQYHNDVSNFITLTYPFMGRTESLVYDGYLILSGARYATRYQKNFDLTSSYHNLKLTSHSVYWRESGEGSALNHSSHLTHLGTGTKAYNTIRYASKESGQCYPRSFHHEIRSHVLDLTTDADWTCREEEEEEGGRKPLYTLRLNLDTNSSMWNTLDMKLEQVIEDVSSDYSREEVTATHAAGTIHVDAEWHKSPKHSEKRVVLCSKDGNCPNAELTLEDFSDGRKTVKFALPNRDDTQITYERKVSSKYKHLDIKVTHYNQQDGLSDVLDFTGEILDRHFHVWRGVLNASSYATVRDLVSSGYAAARGAFARAAMNEGHPLNKILRPALKTSLYDYWNGLKTQVREFFATSWSELFEVVYVAESFTEPVYAIFVNAVNNADEWCSSAYKYLKEKTVTVWAIDYFQLPYYFKEGLAKVPHTLKGLAHQLSLGEENVLYFKYVTGNLLSLGSFRQIPYIDFFPLLQKMTFFKPEDKPAPPYAPWAQREKLAMIFGPHHVYTFDGRLYDVPAYPPSGGCTYLLAHDVQRSLFTVLSTSNSVHLLFPEMTVTIDDENRVYINGSRYSSEPPVQSSNGKVTVSRSHVVEVWSPSLSVVCRAEDFLCAFRLSEYHRGRIVGLLGNADDYATNDFTLPDGNASSNFLDFVQAYEVSGKPACRAESVSTAAAATEPTDDARRTCDQRLAGLCPAKSALREQFTEACASDVAGGLPPCHVTNALAALCHLQHGPTYTDCGAIEQATPSIGRRLEVVLLVQQNKHLTSAKGIESLISALDHKFTESGYERVRFAIVGFGGRGVHSPPTFHAVGKDIWLLADTAVKSGLKSLEFKGREEADGVQALKYALEELGPDSFDSKVFVTITAKDKLVSEKSLMDYLQRRLEANGVTLYALSSYPSIEKGKKVYGVRADGLIFPAPDGGDAYLDFPRGNLAKLAASTRGAVFLAKFLRENEPQTFFSDFAQEVWARVNKEAQKCRRCQSVRGKWWWHMNECEIVTC